MWDLKDFVARGNAIYLEEWEGLAQIIGAFQSPRRREVTQASLLAFLLNVKHVSYPQARRAEGTAFYHEQKIWYNPTYLARETNEDLVLDLVLHELGHLFTYHFAARHGWMWQQVGATVGYMWRAQLTDQQRLVYLKAAKQERLLRSMRRKIEQLSEAA